MNQVIPFLNSLHPMQGQQHSINNNYGCEIMFIC